MPDNNIVEQDHRRIKRLVRPGLGFGSLQTADRTLTGFEAMAMNHDPTRGTSCRQIQRTRGLAFHARHKSNIALLLWPGDHL
jgi:transposase-like protein